MQIIVQSIRRYERSADRNTHDKQTQAVKEVSAFELIFIEDIRIRGCKFHIYPRATKRKPNTVPCHLQEGHIPVFNQLNCRWIIAKNKLRRQPETIIKIVVNRLKTGQKAPNNRIDKHECIN